MRKKKSKKIYLDSSDIYNKELDQYSSPMLCSACPLAYIMHIMRYNLEDSRKDASIYLNPLIED